MPDKHVCGFLQLPCTRTGAREDSAAGYLRCKHTPTIHLLLQSPPSAGTRADRHHSTADLLHETFAAQKHPPTVSRLLHICAVHLLQAHEQTAAIAALRELAAAAAVRQEAIAARLARLGSVADTLAERSGLLAGLHWSLPRPASAAEQQMDKQLEVRGLQDSKRQALCFRCISSSVCVPLFSV
jgi:hypothetical protein